MLAFALRRLLQFIPTILGISLILFLLLNVLPGNAALVAAGDQGRVIDTRFIEQMKKEWGLDKPLHIR
jgi:ABC-type dipeptide/oligopeptide/nickel transport system permease component